ncbi:MAG: OmpA family protein, partial [Candidatus Kapaibacterium sp.]
PGVPNCCREFTGGSGLGLTLGAIYQHPLDEPLYLDFRFAFSTLGAELVEPESTTVIIGGEAVEGTFEHRLDATLTALLLEPSLDYHLTPKLGLRLGAGLGYLLGGSYDQQEVLVKPEDVGVFENNRRTRNEFTGDIPDLNRLLISAHIGLGYDLPLNSRGTLLVTPELQYSRGFSPILKDSSWSVDQLRVGVAITFGGERKEPEVPPIVSLPTQTDSLSETPLRSEPLRAQVTAVGVNEDGVEEKKATLRVEEFISTNMRPLLNYVFFDEGKGTIPPRYTRLGGREKEKFRVEALHNIPTLPTYHHLLNIVGKRMQEFPEATLRIVGCNDGQAEKAEGGLSLSRERAEAVFGYLRSVWEIDSSRLTIETRNLPSKPSNMEVADGVVENRRAELYSDTWEVLAPVITDDTLRVTNPPVIRFRPEAESASPISGYNLNVLQGGDLLKAFRGSPGLVEEIDWDLQEDQTSVPRTEEPITYQLEVRDQAGNAVRTTLDSLPVEQITISKKRRERIADKYIDRYSLILFDFDQAAFNEANDRIGEFIRERIREGATVTITGYTDRIGEEEYNLRLSQRRANQTAKELETEEAEVSGVGESVELHENDLPEGRFYSRTVTIVVETPVE